ncbi:hypothetical protein ACJX0J_039024, partial [Zea mays]
PLTFSYIKYYVLLKFNTLGSRNGLASIGQYRPVLEIKIVIPKILKENINYNEVTFGHNYASWSTSVVRNTLKERYDMCNKNSFLSDHVMKWLVRTILLYMALLLPLEKIENASSFEANLKREANRQHSRQGLSDEDIDNLWLLADGENLCIHHLKHNTRKKKLNTQKKNVS